MVGDIPAATLQPNGSGGVNVFYIHTDRLNAQLTWGRSARMLCSCAQEVY